MSGAQTLLAGGVTICDRVSAKLRAFVGLTRGGMGVSQASRQLGITLECASRALKRRLVELLAEKLAAKLH